MPEIVPVRFDDPRVSALLEDDPEEIRVCDGLAIYRSVGFSPIPPYGEFPADARTRCRGLSL